MHIYMMMRRTFERTSAAKRLYLPSIFVQSAKSIKNYVAVTKIVVGT